MICCSAGRARQQPGQSLLTCLKPLPSSSAGGYDDHDENHADDDHHDDNNDEDDTDDNDDDIDDDHDDYDDHRDEFDESLLYLMYREEDMTMECFNKVGMTMKIIFKI